MVFFTLLFLSYMPTTLCFSFYHANSIIVMLYIVHTSGFDTFVISDFYKLFQYGRMVVSKLCRLLQVSNLGRCLVTDSMA